jgi:hypothetical protein
MTVDRMTDFMSGVVRKSRCSQREKATLPRCLHTVLFASSVVHMHFIPGGVSGQPYTEVLLTNWIENQVSNALVGLTLSCTAHLSRSSCLVAFFANLRTTRSMFQHSGALLPPSGQIDPRFAQYVLQAVSDLYSPSAHPT